MMNKYEVNYVYYSPYHEKDKNILANASWKCERNDAGNWHVMSSGDHINSLEWVSVDFSEVLEDISRQMQDWKYICDVYFLHFCVE